MPTSYRCPQCNRLLTAPDDISGQEVQCPNCELVFNAESTEKDPSLDSQLEAHNTPQVPTFDQGNPSSSLLTGYPQPIRKRRFSKPEEENKRRVSKPGEYYKRGLLIDDEDDNEHDQPYRTHTKLKGSGSGRAAIIFFGVYIGHAIVAVVGSLWYFNVAERQWNGEYVPEKELALLDWVISANWQVSILTGLIGLLFFYIWVYQAHKNLDRLGVKNRKFTPAWAIACFFIPILNFFKPYQAMQELWKASKGAYTRDRSGEWKQYPGSDLVWWWWIFWVVNYLVAIVRDRITRSQYDNLEQLQTSLNVVIVSGVLSVLAAVASIRVILLIQAYQNKEKQMAGFRDTTSDNLED